MVTQIYTDGACAKNPGGRGGWAVILVNEAGERVLSGSDPSTTNNRMELHAAIVGLEHSDGPVDVVSDSKYVVDGASKWIEGWKRKGWRTKDGAVKNEDLWRRIDHLSYLRDVRWVWVRGHNGHRYNERCDVLASREAGIDPTGQSRWPRERYAPRLRK